MSKNGEILRKIAKEKFGSANKMADELGMGHVSLNKYITGKRNIGMKTLQKLASIGIDTSVFDFSDTDTAEKPLIIKAESNGLGSKGDLKEVIGITPSERTILVPLIEGAASAGSGSFMEDVVARYIRINKYYNEHTFYIRVQGDSMKMSGITEGDLLLIDPEKPFEHNSIVLAKIDKDYYIKRIKKNGGTYLLVPDNPEYNPILVTEETEILGVAIKKESYF